MTAKNFDWGGEGMGKGRYEGMHWILPLYSVKLLFYSFLKTIQLEYLVIFSRFNNGGK